MALEQTINRDCKTAGGVLGFTQEEHTLTRWIVSRHILGDYCSKFQHVVDDTCEQKEYHFSESRNNRDESDVNKILGAFEDTWVNPFNFNGTPELFHIASGKIASENIRRSLNSFMATAKKYMDNYIANTLTDEGNNSFWASHKKYKVQTFKESNIPLKTQPNKSKRLLSPEFMFRRIISAAKFQNLDFSNLLKYELTLVPSSLFFEDGSLRKSPKSELAKRLKSYCDISRDIPAKFNSYIVDAMVLIQEISKKHINTYADIGDCIFKKLLTVFDSNENCNQILLIFDRYNIPNSIKQYERQRRGQSFASTFSIISEQVKVTDYSKFL
ncbi:hypothetical protein PPYR_06573 [Photinus pyralis]|uniref:Uncharacterized protein n=2 Tax=Photinus pyralis TaxID=7054 RepID=A0A5N4AU14_PHOPY|nr:hypothetical protein PPYR_06573 [Photinus pyralis]